MKHQEVKNWLIEILAIIPDVPLRDRLLIAIGTRDFSAVPYHHLVYVFERLCVWHGFMIARKVYKGIRVNSLASMEVTELRAAIYGYLIAKLSKEC